MGGNENDSRASADPPFGIFLLIVGLLALCFVPRIKDQGLGHNNDPGPRSFPTGLAICLLIGGAAYTVKGFRQSRGRVSGANTLTAAPTAKSKAGISGGASYTSPSRAVILLVALALYAAAIPWLGFAVSTLLFSFLMMLLLGVRWLTAAIVAFGLVVMIHLLFVLLFKVQLPRGFLA